MKDILNRLDLENHTSGTFCGSWIEDQTANTVESYSPINGQKLGSVCETSDANYERVIAESADCFLRWREYPAPKRGEVIRQIGEELRSHVEDLGQLVTAEMGKIVGEGIGEVQEVIDMADFAVGLSRQLYGLSMHSERPQHRMYEQWHPLGIVGVITAFNFPAAVWGWNACLAAVCGDTVVWKPSSVTPLVGVALTKLSHKVTSQHGFDALFSLISGRGSSIGAKLCEDKRIPLISATGSCRLGRIVGETVARRLGRSLLELGGNNAIIVLADADMDLAVRAVVFGAVGTAGQRCTTTRRILVEKSVKDQFLNSLKAAYKQIRIGNPLDANCLMGPLVRRSAVDDYNTAIDSAKRQGGKVIYGAEELKNQPSDCYVMPTIIEATHDMEIVFEETFAPILYVIEVDSVEQAIRYQNCVSQGLSSAIFTNSLRSAEKFLASTGSDCGIANVNIGTSGAEIGGAFGGEKDTGGGREAGSDSWKAYMRRQTCTINWGEDLPLAQGIDFS
jgi:aldehyde dehydrogenase (NAD+)